LHACKFNCTMACSCGSVKVAKDSVGANMLR
jgi:hypothetical protein